MGLICSVYSVTNHRVLTTCGHVAVHVHIYPCIAQEICGVQCTLPIVELKAVLK